jgi:hypothetical protein
LQKKKTKCLDFFRNQNVKIFQKEAEKTKETKKGEVPNGRRPSYAPMRAWVCGAPFAPLMGGVEEHPTLRVRVCDGTP